MHPRRILGGALAVGSLAASLALASPAFASPTVWVQSGSSTSGTVSYTATNTNVFRIADLRSGGFFDCPIGTVTITGSITLGTAVANPPLTTITGTSFVEGSSGCKFSGLNVRVAGAASSANPWNLNVTGSSTPATTGAPQANQTTPGSITNVLATTVTINPSTASGAPGASDCSITFAGGVDSGNPAPTPPNYGTKGTISPITYTNAGTPTISILTTSSAASATIGVNRAWTGTTYPGTRKDPALNQGCAANALQAGDKAQIRSSASATTPATFAVTNTGSGPLWVRA